MRRRLFLRALGAAIAAQRGSNPAAHTRVWFRFHVDAFAVKTRIEAEAAAQAFLWDRLVSQWIDPVTHRADLVAMRAGFNKEVATWFDRIEPLA